MKQKELFAELIETAGKLGIKIRQEKGFFKGGLLKKTAIKLLSLIRMPLSKLCLLLWCVA